jgi:hypothetical protein
MTTPGRNEPCPCGSGKKYKHCHWQIDLDASQPPPEMVWFGRALDWLQGRFAGALGDAVDASYDAALGDIDDFEERIEALDADAMDELALSTDEFLLLDCTFERRGERRLGIDWVRDAADLRWDDAARRFLDGLAETPMRLHRVEKVVDGVSITVRDAMLPTASAIVVPEVALSEGATAGDLIGARLLTIDGVPNFGPSIHFFAREIALEVLQDAATTLDALPESRQDEAARQAALTAFIRQTWLRQLFADQPGEADE